MVISKPILHNIHYPSDLRKLKKTKLEGLCNELRQETIEIVSKTGGHLGAGLGVIELTVAIHYVFNTPKDKLIWDIGHQAYPHKILTGRREKMLSLRQPGGISGFTKRLESEYDSFIGGHGGTAVSSALGMALARDHNQEKHEVITVIGDGSMSAGMAYEAMNNAGNQKSRLIVILNDNKMSISPAVGALTTYLAKLISSKQYLSFRNSSKKILNLLPNCFKKIFKKFERNTKDLINDGNFFEEMGFYYLGPINGHNIEELVLILENIKNDHSITKPILLHVITEKGKGFISSKNCSEKYHAVAKFDLDTKIQEKSSIPTYTEIFAENLIKIAKEDKQVFAITAAMPSGTGLDKFAKHFPERMFDVGMAEQHAVTFAAGLACEGIKPFVAIYSTFLQRAYDQVINDVALQKLPVRFIIDRAGFVGADGPTHCGAFDITYLCALPNFIVMCPSNEVELILMMYTAHHINDAPCSIRFPRGQALSAQHPKKFSHLPIGKGKLIRKGERVAIISLGTKLNEATKAADLFKQKYGYDITIFDSRFAKPIDKKAILEIAKEHEIIITIEEGAIGGFSSQVNNILLPTKIKIKNLFYPDIFMDQDTQEAMNNQANLNSSKILKIIEDLSL
ncbi:MAG: 1-deoxy-D-xylulose-5-phosphate synthase [Pseudomonadota bacterium]